MSTPLSPTAPSPQNRYERIGRGALFALLVVPVGVVIWTAIWSAGIVASIVAFIVALGAVWLYRKGSGGVISRPGAWIVTLIVVGTLLLAFFSGMVVDLARALGGLDTINDPRFWPTFQYYFPRDFKADLPSFGLALLFCALGSFRVLARAFATARETETTALFGTGPATVPGSGAPTIAPTTAPAVQPTVQPTEGTNGTVL